MPSATWRLRDAIDFDFPTNIVLGAGQRVLIVPFDPALDISALAAFRTAYPSSTNAPLFGPWQGRLDNSGDWIELRKPGQLVGSGDVPSVLVDAVHYRNTPPWAAAAAGQGSSLQRATLTAYGNDPTNWFAAGISPGSASLSNQPPIVTITSPATNSSFILPGNLSITVSATDSDGSVGKVEFFADGAKLAERTNAPYNIVWTNPPPGLHSLMASARDNSGNYGTSAPVNINATLPSVSVTRSGPDLDLSWPSNSAGYNLYRATNLTAPITWLRVTNLPAFSNDQWILRLGPPTNAASFYRLQWP